MLSSPSLAAGKNPTDELARPDPDGGVRVSQRERAVQNTRGCAAYFVFLEKSAVTA